MLSITKLRGENNEIPFCVMTEQVTEKSTVSVAEWLAFFPQSQVARTVEAVADKELATNKQNIVVAVSYTHLDVYKRQALMWFKVKFKKMAIIKMSIVTVLIVIHKI